MDNFWKLKKELEQKQNDDLLSMYNEMICYHNDVITSLNKNLGEKDTIINALSEEIEVLKEKCRAFQQELTFQKTLNYTSPVYNPNPLFSTMPFYYGG